MEDGEARFALMVPIGGIRARPGWSASASVSTIIYVTLHLRAQVDISTRKRCWSVLPRRPTAEYRGTMRKSIARRLIFHRTHGFGINLIDPHC